MSDRASVGKPAHHHDGLAVGWPKLTGFGVRSIELDESVLG